MQKILKNKTFRIVSIVVVLGVLSWGVYRSMPRQADISESEIFSREQVEDAMKETIEHLDAADYEALRENADSGMQSALNEETLKPAKEEIADVWGARQRFGKMYITEISKGDTHYAVGEVTVTYEEVSVTYRLTYDRGMRLAGLYMK